MKENDEDWEENDEMKQRRLWRKQDTRLREAGKRRVIKLFNLISSRNSYIAEQIAMILANVSCSGETDFRFEFISDLCMKTLTRIVNAPTDQHQRSY